MLGVGTPVCCPMVINCCQLTVWSKVKNTVKKIHQNKQKPPIHLSKSSNPTFLTNINDAVHDQDPAYNHTLSKLPTWQKVVTIYIYNSFILSYLITVSSLKLRHTSKSSLLLYSWHIQFNAAAGSWGGCCSSKYQTYGSHSHYNLWTQTFEPSPHFMMILISPALAPQF